MNAPTTRDPTHVPASVFTLGSALAWRGHDCPHDETPAIVARVPDGFVAEPTYGPEVCCTATSLRPEGA